MSQRTDLTRAQLRAAEARAIWRVQNAMVNRKSTVAREIAVLKAIRTRLERRSA